MKENEIVEKIGLMYGKNFVDIQEVEDFLSSKFENYIDRRGDAQLAFNDINHELNGLLGEFFCYSLSKEGETWQIGIGEKFEGSRMNEYLEIFRDYYSEDFKDLEDMRDKLERRVMKDMSNVGCDAKTALGMILDEDLGLPGVFAISGADGPFRILYGL